MSPHEQLEIFLHRNKINLKSILELLPRLSSKVVGYILKDLEEFQTKENITRDNKVYVFTDGNCKNNGKQNAKAGYGVFFTEDESSPLCKFNTSGLVLVEPTNQKAELTAIYKLFTILHENVDIFTQKHIIVCTDSQYSIKCITDWSKKWLENNWKTSKGAQVKNAEIINNIIQIKTQLESNGIEIGFKHVFSHQPPPTETNSLEYTLWKGNCVVDAIINENLKL